MNKQAELRWRAEKYRVMFHSQQHYNAIRIAMREQQPYDIIAAMIDEAIATPPTAGSMRNACQHMWGYFKKFATVDEKARYNDYVAQDDYRGLCRYLAELAAQYNVTYLQNSTILQEDYR